MIVYIITLFFDPLESVHFWGVLDTLKHVQFQWGRNVYQTTPEIRK